VRGPIKNSVLVSSLFPLHQDDSKAGAERQDADCAMLVDAPISLKACHFPLIALKAFAFI